MTDWKVRAALEAGQVTLNLSHQDLHVLPDSVIEFPLLQEIDASYNFLVGDVFSKLKRAATLKALNLRCNYISGSVSEDLGACSALTTLIVEENLITTLPDSLAELLELRHVSFRRNSISLLSPTWFRPWLNLRFLDFRDNKIRVLPEEISACSLLERLLIGQNEIEVLPDKIGKLKFLTELQVYNNKLTALPVMLGHCAKLTLLHAGGNQVRPSSSSRRTTLCSCVTFVALLPEPVDDAALYLLMHTTSALHLHAIYTLLCNTVANGISTRALWYVGQFKGAAAAQESDSRSSS